MHSAFLHFVPQILQSAGDSLPALWRSASQSAAALAVTAIWQGALVALVLALCLRLAPRTPARHRFALWAAGFGVLVALQILPVLEPLLPAHVAPAIVSAAPSGLGASATHPLLQLNAAWTLVIAVLWLAASLYRGADLAFHSFQLRKLWKTAVPVEVGGQSQSRSLDCISRRKLCICTTRELERPSVIGFFAPRILIPEWLFARLTPGELDQIVLHEAEHLRRRDDWSNLLQKICLVLFPLNPGLAWIERRLCREREMACDDGVIRITRAPRAYAACLTSLAERGLQRRAGALSLGAWHGRPELVRRVHSILARKHALSPAAASAVLGAVGCVLLAGGTALARCPRLVAFVPAHRAPQIAPAAKARVSVAHLSAATSLPERNLRERKANKVAEAAAVPPELHAHRSPQRASARSTAASVPAAPELASIATGKDALAPRPETSIAARETGFFVMTTWENLEPAGSYAPEPGAKAATEKSSVHIAGPVNAFAVHAAPRLLRVTRMYLQIYSSAGQSTWLVVQL
jgi:beta-lactamase regulating signal transducer with metallopeptidase domain